MNTNSPGRPKVNPNYDPVAARDQMAKAVAEIYLHPSSNMDTDEEGHATMKELQDHFGLTMTKIRKLLVTAGVYHFYKDGVDMVEAVQKLSKEGKSLEEIKDILHISTDVIEKSRHNKLSIFITNNINSIEEAIIGIVAFDVICLLNSSKINPI